MLGQANAEVDGQRRGAEPTLGREHGRYTAGLALSGAAPETGQLVERRQELGLLDGPA
jgi:hypothetical protein